MARIAVAATAPFGADVLERLAGAARGRDRSSPVPTRRPARGRRVRRPPAKDVAERLGIPVLQPERPTAGLELDAPTVVVCAYGLLIPDELLAERTVAQRPPVAPAALARCGARRAGDHGRRRGDGRHDPRDGRRAGRRPVAAQEAFPIGQDDDAGAVYARAAEVAAALLDDVLAQPHPDVRPAGRRGELRREDRPRRPPARPRPARRRSWCAGRPRAQPAHRRPRRARGAAGHGVARARRRTAASSRSRCSPRAAGGWSRRMAARAPVTRLAGAPRGVRRSCAGSSRTALRGPGAPLAVRGGPRRARPRARAPPRLRHGAGAAARSTTRSRPSAAAPSAKLDPPVRAALRLGAYQLAFLDGVPRYAAVNESVELVRGARLQAGGAVRERGPATAGRRASRPLMPALPEGTAPEAALRHSYPDWIAETWWRELGPTTPGR